MAYSPFGTVLASSGSSANRLKYTGREDDGTGLYYYRARYYDPAIGRFISEDPKGFEADINFYAYVGNNPVNGNDPFGEDANVPYPNQTEAQIAAGRYVAARTKYDPLGRENGAYVYQYGDAWFHTVAVVSTGKINEVRSEDFAMLSWQIPDGARNVQQVHSHPSPPMWQQFPSTQDYQGTNRSATGFGVLGLIDGTVLLFAGGNGMIAALTPEGSVTFRPPRTRAEAPGITQLTPPGDLPNPFLDRDDPPLPPGGGKKLSLGDYAPSVGGDSVVYPSWTGTSGLDVVYRK